MKCWFNSAKIICILRKWSFTTDDKHDKHLIKWMWVEKNYVEKRLLNKMKSWWGKDIDQNISVRSLTLLICAVEWGWDCVVDHKPNTSQWCHCSHFLRQMFSSIKTLSSVTTHLQKVVSFIRFIYSRAFNNNVISNGKSYCCNDTFTDIRLTSLLAKNIWEEYKLFFIIFISYLSELFIRIDYFV